MKYILFFALLLSCSPPKEIPKPQQEVIIASEVEILPEIQIIKLNVECPDDMVLVDGDYCPNLSEPCLEWANKSSTVCKRFAYPTKCLSQKLKHMRFCVDRREYTEPGEVLPKVMINYYEMGDICKAQNKRLCQDLEVTKACEGPDNKPYPYGYERDSTACDIDKPYIEWNQIKIQHKDKKELEKVDQRIPSGSMLRCISDYGAYDLVGGVDEISENVSRGGKPYNLSLHGGHDLRGASNQCRKTTNVHNNWFILYNSGGRCCKDIK